MLEKRAQNSRNEDSESSFSKNKIKQLESELGVPLDESESKVANLKDHMRETKNTFKKNQKQAEEFVTKLNAEKKKVEEEARKKHKKELEKYQKVRYFSYTPKFHRIFSIIYMFRRKKPATRNLHEELKN